MHLNLLTCLIVFFFDSSIVSSVPISDKLENAIPNYSSPAFMGNLYKFIASKHQCSSLGNGFQTCTLGQLSAVPSYASTCPFNRTSLQTSCVYGTIQTPSSLTACLYLDPSGQYAFQNFAFSLYVAPFTSLISPVSNVHCCNSTALSSTVGFTDMKVKLSDANSVCEQTGMSLCSMKDFQRKTDFLPGYANFIAPVCMGV